LAQGLLWLLHATLHSHVADYRSLQLLPDRRAGLCTGVLHRRSERQLPSWALRTNDHPVHLVLRLPCEDRVDPPQHDHRAHIRIVMAGFRGHQGRSRMLPSSAACAPRSFCHGRGGMQSAGAWRRSSSSISFAAQIDPRNDMRISTATVARRLGTASAGTASAGAAFRTPHVRPQNSALPGVRGKGMTSRMFVIPVMNCTMRSSPKPNPE